MCFLVDAQLPPALADWLTKRGHAAEHVSDVNLNEADDSTIWRYALSHGAVIVTKDEDFAHRHRQGGDSPIIVWLRVGNTSRKALLEWFEPLMPRIETCLDDGERLVEVR